MLARGLPVCGGRSVGVETVRSMGRRAPKQGKPPILPPSKKALYHVVHTPWQKATDVEELLWRRLAYNNAIISLREVFRAELESKQTAGTGLEAMKDDEEKELAALLEKAELRNQQRAQLRKQREEQDWNDTRNEVLAEMEQALASRKIAAEKSAVKVRNAIERSQHFVTSENLEEQILLALDKPVMYDFAIDRSGTKYVEDAPYKYQEGAPTRQKGRLHEKTLGPFPQADKLPPSSILPPSDPPSDPPSAPPTL